MKLRIRIAAVIIENCKMLLVKGKYKEFWIPGGKANENETELETLEREFKEELDVKIVSPKFFKEYLSKSPYIPDTMTKTRIYLAQIKGNMKPSNEINNFIWMSRDDFNNKKYSLLEITEKSIIPDLIKRGIF